MSAEPTTARADDDALVLAACCGAPVLDAAALGAAVERRAYPVADGLMRVDLYAPGLACAACLGDIERALGAEPGVASARANLTRRRVGVVFDPARFSVRAAIAALARLGLDATPFDAAAADAAGSDATLRELLSCLAVAAFASMNVMLLSISVWTGADGPTRDLMHWVSAAIALPAVAYSGRPFFKAAWAALKRRRLVMETPIALAVILASGVSLYETAGSGAHAYFDAAITLLFFLLIGRVLDHRTRGLARSAAAELSLLSVASAMRLGPDGGRVETPIDELAVGDLVWVAPGARAPADGVVLEGRSDLDRSLLTGETTPAPVAPGASVHAGMTNLTGPLTLRVTAVQEGTLLAEIARLIEAAERADTRFIRLADRAARFYSPAIHIVAGLAFAGWMAATGDARHALMVATALLVITCPCALALAVPAVQAVASGRLFRGGVLLKDGAALEKLALVDIVAFDKTGTLTLGKPEPVDALDPADPTLRLAAALAHGSRHPLAQALAQALPGADGPRLLGLRERPGEGVEALLLEGSGANARSRRVRLGRGDWVGAEDAQSDAFSRVWIGVEGAAPRAIRFRDRLRPDAAATVAALREAGLEVRLLSGDTPAAAADCARTLGIGRAEGGLRPEQKLAALTRLAAEGRRVLMVGDGLNDAPALAAASVSMSPASGADVSRAAADLVFTGASLAAVAEALNVAKAARRRALENFLLAAGYNLISIPLAAAGFVTPFIAALAMSTSSILVTLNALRIGRAARGAAPRAAEPARRLAQARTRKEARA